MKKIDLAVARPEGDEIRLNLTIDGKTEVFTISRRAAASLIATTAEALAKSH